MPFPKGGKFSKEARRKMSLAAQRRVKNSKSKKQVMEAMKLAIRASAILPRTKKQLEVSRRTIRIASSKAASKPRTAEQLKSIKKAASISNSKETWRIGLEAICKKRKHKNGYCQICQKHCFLQKDHDHKTGQRRGKLCFKCNVALGLFGDKVQRLKAAIIYLRYYRGLMKGK